MKKKVLVSLTLSLLLAGAAFAEPEAGCEDKLVKEIVVEDEGVKKEVAEQGEDVKDNVIEQVKE